MDIGRPDRGLDMRGDPAFGHGATPISRNTGLTLLSCGALLAAAVAFAAGGYSLRPADGTGQQSQGSVMPGLEKCRPLRPRV